MVFNPLQQMALQALQASQNPTAFAQQAALQGQSPLSTFGPALGPGSGGALPGLGIGLPMTDPRINGSNAPAPGQFGSVPVGNSSIPPLPPQVNLPPPPQTPFGGGVPNPGSPQRRPPAPQGFRRDPGSGSGSAPSPQQVPPVPGGPQRRPEQGQNPNFPGGLLNAIQQLQGGLQGVQAPSGAVAPPTPVAGTVSGVGGPAPDPAGLLALLQLLSGGQSLGAGGGIPPALGALIGGR